MSEEISYAQLFDLLRKEKTKEDLQVIEKTFYKDRFSILNKRETDVRVKEMQHSLVINPDLEKQKIELRNIKKLLNELLDRRQKKIILLALTRTRIPSTIINNEAFSEEEKDLFEETVKLFRTFKQNVVSVQPVKEIIENPDTSAKESESEDNLKQETPLSNSTNTDEITKDEKTEINKDIVKKPTADLSVNIKVKFLVPTSNFYGPQKQILGPYEKDQIVALPKIIADILIKKERAEKVE